MLQKRREQYHLLLAFHGIVGHNLHKSRFVIIIITKRECFKNSR